MILKTVHDRARVDGRPKANLPKKTRVDGYLYAVSFRQLTCISTSFSHTNLKIHVCLKFLSFTLSDITFN